MYPQNLHTHGILCDSKDEYESTVKRAIELGFTSIGFSEHSQMSYSPTNGLTPDNTFAYKKTINALKRKYDGVIDVFCGVEFDMYSEDTLDGYDYVIGSVHYLKQGDEFIAIDRPLDTVKKVIDEKFGGDGLKLAKAYYEEIIRLPNCAKKCDIVGHFDIITKNNELERFIDESDKTYRAYAVEAVRKLSRYVRIFEINTGAIARGYRKTPYPAPFILQEINRLGCDIIISSDCHDNAKLDFKFNESAKLAKACGFTKAVILTKTGFKRILL